MKRWVSLILICVMLFGMNIVSFAKERTILALGDSISAGYGLSDREGECFVSLMAFSGDSIINKAVDGNKAVDIIDQLINVENENYVSCEDVENADFVTVTCGGNDMMALLYEKIATEYNETTPRGSITADKVLEELSTGKNLYLMLAALRVLDCDEDAYYMNDGEFDVRLSEFMENLLAIVEYIHEINPKAEVVIATQYNPYVEFEGVTLYGVLYSGMEDGATRLNNAIADNAEIGGYTVAHVKSAFDQYTGTKDLYNANPDTGSLNLDFHPSKAGHEVIAHVFGNIINVHKLGKENGDGTYSLPDNVVGYYITDASEEVRFVDAGVYKAEDGEIVETVYMNIAMVDGAQVRIKDGNGLRFLATVDRSGFDAAGYGMKVSCEGSDEEIFVDASVWQSDTCFSVAIENMQAENYCRNYTATPFVRVRSEDGSEKVVCGTQSVTRSIYTVAKGLLDKGGLDEAVKEALYKYVN